MPRPYPEVPQHGVREQDLTHACWRGSLYTLSLLTRWYDGQENCPGNTAVGVAVAARSLLNFVPATVRDSAEGSSEIVRALSGV